MKKQKIQFIVILIVLAVLIAATFGMKWYNKNKEEEKTAEEEASTIYISKVDVDTITAFSYEVDHVTYTFTPKIRIDIPISSLGRQKHRKRSTFAKTKEIKP